VAPPHLGDDLGRSFVELGGNSGGPQTAPVPD